MQAHSGVIEPGLNEHPDFQVSDMMPMSEVKPEHFDDVFRFDIIRDPQLGDSALGRMMASALPLAITNILLINMHMEPVFDSDGDCNCGQCDFCSTKVQLLDHSLDVAAYRCRKSLKAWSYAMQESPRVKNLKLMRESVALVS